MLLADQCLPDLVAQTLLPPQVLPVRVLLPRCPTLDLTAEALALRIAQLSPG